MFIFPLPILHYHITIISLCIVINNINDCKTKNKRNIDIVTQRVLIIINYIYKQ